MPFYDFTSGFVAVKKHVLKDIQFKGSYGEYFIDFIVRAHDKKYKVIEVPYTSAARLHGSSKTAPTLQILLKRIYQYTTMVIQVLFR